MSNLRTKWALSLMMFSCANMQALAQNQGMTRADFTRESHQADVFIKEKHWDTAKIILRKLVATPYATAHEFLELAYSYISTFPSREDWTVVDRCCIKALELEPECGHAYTGLAYVAIDGNNDNKRCIMLATRAINSKQPDNFGYYLRGRAFAAEKKYAKALEDFEKWDSIIASKDKTHTTIEMQGQLLEKLQRYDEAIARYKVDQQRHPEATMKNVVRCYESQSKLSEAINEVTKLIKINPDDSDAFNLRANLKLKTKDMQGALADYNQAITLSPTSSYYRSRAHLYEVMGKADLAKKDLAEAERSPI